jgi:hypothetical protein
MLMASSPYAKSGPLWDKTKRYWGKMGPILVWRAATWIMHPSLVRESGFIARKYEEDPVSAAAEYGAEFRSDVSAFVAREIVEACVVTDVYERTRIRGMNYKAFVDPSGGSNDAMTLAIGHRYGEMAVLDAIRERIPPFSPDGVVEEFCHLLKDYGINEVTGDNYGVEWVREQFRKHGIYYRRSELTRSELYLNFLPVLNSASIELLDSPSAKLVNQISALERRVARGGRESVNHPPMGHDDLANAVAGVASLIGRPAPQPTALFGTQNLGGNSSNSLCGRYVSSTPNDPHEAWDRWHLEHQT